MSEQEYRKLIKFIRESITNSTDDSEEAHQVASRLASDLYRSCQWEKWRQEDKKKKIECTLEDRERQRIASAYVRTRKAGLPSNLTVTQWLVTLEHFEWKCVYCQVRRFQILEHFLPVELGGGTTASNCVPACRSCNIMKSRLHPDLIDSVFSPCVVNQVRIYLQQFQ